MIPVLGIDPGAKGGFAWRNIDGQHFVSKMPDTPGDVCEALREIYVSNPHMVAIMEKVGGYTGGAGAPGSAMFNFGHGVGFMEGVIMALGIPLELCTPQKWQKHFQLGTRGDLSKTEWKNKAKAEAQRRYPEIKVTLDVSDALLIMAYKVERMR